MTKNKAPAFPMYAGDLLSDVNFVLMDLEARGAYWTLLCHAWIEEGIPNDPKKISKILGITPEKLSTIWPSLAPCFAVEMDDGGKVSNRRLENERKKLKSYQKTQSERSKKRWHKPMQNNTNTSRRNARVGNAVGMPWESPRGECSSSSSSFSLSTDSAIQDTNCNNHASFGFQEKEKGTTEPDRPPDRWTTEDIKAKAWEIQAALELDDSEHAAIMNLVCNHFSRINPALTATRDRMQAAQEGTQEPVENVMAYFTHCVKNPDTFGGDQSE